MSKTTEEWTEGLSEKGIEFYHKIESIGSGELKGYGELSASSWAHRGSAMCCTRRTASSSSSRSTA